MSLGWWEGLVLGLVQGLTEFLPISSSGHLVLAEELLGFRSPGLTVEIALHLATLLSVVVAYRVRIRDLLRGLATRDRGSWRYALLLVVASVPAALAGLLFRDWFAATFESGVSLGVQFLLTAAILLSTRPALARATRPEIGVGAALLIGVAQAVSILPAISRSGATIAAALWLRIAPGPAAEFSFLMSIIAIFGSGLLELRHLDAGAGSLTSGLLVGAVAAMVSGVWAIRFLVALLARQRFHAFAGYCAVVGLFTILWYSVLRP